ncbi:MAG TPA: CPBP family intramembrane glutamic endopeptidase, partial [Acidobacteriota bacterium]|nr:CPBP family intramembrane glutamic endopeptidase [Acidobacteriota bacterium]
QVVLVLAGLTALYIANSLMPWSIGLLQRHDHSFYFPFWSSTSILHWGSVALIVFLLKRVGGRLADIGLDLSPIKAAAMIGIPLVVGLLLTLMQETAAANHSPPSVSSAVLPASLGERLFWIFMSFTAGFCEELIYRGFSIHMLQRHKVRTWLAVVLATLAFFFMHGISAIALPHFLTIYIAGLLFSFLFLWRRSLLPGICLHALIDVANIGVP